MSNPFRVLVADDDDVMRQLNLVRIGDSTHHAAVLHLETSLRNLNDGQGLGFLLLAGQRDVGVALGQLQGRRWRWRSRSSSADPAR